MFELTSFSQNMDAPGQPVSCVVRVTDQFGIRTLVHTLNLQFDSADVDAISKSGPGKWDEGDLCALIKAKLQADVAVAKPQAPPVQVS
jgi:hypothetical protein